MLHLIILKYATLISKKKCYNNYYHYILHFIILKDVTLITTKICYTTNY